MTVKNIQCSMKCIILTYLLVLVDDNDRINITYVIPYPIS